VKKPVAFTNRSNSAFVTGARSIQNPSTETRCSGSASGMPQLSHPIQNVPLAIHTMFAGTAGRGDRQAAMAIGTTTRRIEATRRMRALVAALLHVQGQRRGTRSIVANA